MYVQTCCHVCYQDCMLIISDSHLNGPDKMVKAFEISRINSSQMNTENSAQYKQHIINDRQCTKDELKNKPDYKLRRETRKRQGNTSS